MSKYVFAVLALAFLSLAGICAFQRQEIKAITAERDLAKRAGLEYATAALDNGNAAEKLNGALKACQLRLFLNAQNKQDAERKHSEELASLSAKLSADRAKQTTSQAGTCSEWAKQPACGVAGS